MLTEYTNQSRILTTVTTALGVYYSVDRSNTNLKTICQVFAVVDLLLTE